MELQQLAKQYINSTLSNIINSKDRSHCRMYDNAESTLNLFTGKISEKYSEKQIDKNLQILHMEVWEISNRNRGIRDIFVLSKQNYLNNIEKQTFANKFLNIISSNRFSRVCYIEYNNNFDIIVTTFEHNKSQIYKSFNEFMLNVYNINCDEIIENLYNEIQNPSYDNKIFNSYIECMERNHYDDDLTKLSILIFQDLFEALAINDSINNTNYKTFYTSNIDCFCRSINGIDTIYEFKNKTINNDVFINEKEFELLEDLSSPFNVYINVMMSFNEKHTKNFLIEKNIVLGDTDLYHLSFNKDIRKYAKKDTSKVYKIPLRYFINFTTLQHNKIIQNNKQIPYFEDLQDINKYKTNLTCNLIANLKENDIIKSKHDLEIIETPSNISKNSMNVFNIKTINEKIAMKYVFDLAWRIDIKDFEIKSLIDNNINLIGITRICKNKNTIEFLGYTTINDFILNSNKCAAIPNIRINNEFWKFCEKPEDEQNDLILKHGLTYVYSLNENGTIKNGSLRQGVKKYVSLKQFNEYVFSDNFKESYNLILNEIK